MKFIRDLFSKEDPYEEFNRHRKAGTLYKLKHKDCDAMQDKYIDAILSHYRNKPLSEQAIIVRRYFYEKL
jgi:hypothetical protein